MCGNHKRDKHVGGSTDCGKGPKIPGSGGILCVPFFGSSPISFILRLKSRKAHSCSGWVRPGSHRENVREEQKSPSRCPDAPAGVCDWCEGLMADTWLLTSRRLGRRGDLQASRGWSIASKKWWTSLSSQCCTTTAHRFHLEPFAVRCG